MSEIYEELTNLEIERGALQQRIRELEEENERLKAENRTWKNLATTDEQWFREDAERWRKACELGYIREHYVIEIDAANGAVNKAD